jgi:hypothetical protein
VIAIARVPGIVMRDRVYTRSATRGPGSVAKIALMNICSALAGRPLAGNRTALAMLGEGSRP